MWLDPETTLIQMGAARVVAGADKYADAAGAAHYIVARVTEAHHALSEVTTFGLFPLALVLFAAHENYRAHSEGTVFRTRYFVMRTIGVFVAILLYGKICSLICTVCGSGSGFLKPDNFLKEASKSFDYMDAAMARLGGGDGSFTDNMKAMPKFIALMGVWLVTMVCALFAHVANLLLAKSQGLLILILVALGKGCIAASLCPGVGLGKSWARALAQVAFWSTVAGVINFGNVLERRAGVFAYVAGADYTGLFMCSGQFIIIGIFTLAVPKITAAVFSGAAPGAVGVGAAMLLGAKGLMMAGQDAKNITRGAADGAKGALDKARGKDEKGDKGGQRGLNKLDDGDGDRGGRGGGGGRDHHGGGGGGSHAPLVQRATALAVGAALWPFAKAANSLRSQLGEHRANNASMRDFEATRSRQGGEADASVGVPGTPGASPGAGDASPPERRADELQQQHPGLPRGGAVPEAEDTVARVDSAPSRSEPGGIGQNYSDGHPGPDRSVGAIDPGRSARGPVAEAAQGNVARLEGAPAPHGRPQAAAQPSGAGHLAEHGDGRQAATVQSSSPRNNDDFPAAAAPGPPPARAAPQQHDERAAEHAPREDHPPEAAPQGANRNVIRRPPRNDASSMPRIPAKTGD